MRCCALSREETQLTDTRPSIHLSQLPLTLEDLEASLEPALLHYLCFRPHEGLNSATPAEAFLSLDPVHHVAVELLRGRPGEGPREIPFQIEYADRRNRRLPVLKPAA